MVNAWFSLPELNDDADIILKELEKEVQETKEADVFFIHLTTYFSSYSWNQDLNNEDGIYDPANWLSSQVSVFNKCCRIFSPRYRQATFMSYFGKEDGFRARDLAFKDILASFDHYINKYNDGRPIIIAGHSQGAELGMRLLYERFHNKPLREQLVTAYIPGWTFSSKDLLEIMPDIPPCKSKSQLSCLNTWRTTGKSYNFDLWPLKAIDLNPLPKKHTYILLLAVLFIELNQPDEAKNILQENQAYDELLGSLLLSHADKSSNSEPNFSLLKDAILGQVAGSITS